MIKSTTSDNVAKEPRTIKWISVDWGTPSRAVTKVLTKNEDGIVGEGIYDRRNRTWAKPDGSRLDRITHWSLIPNSPITRKVV